jgi:hypothetical protein
MVGSSAVDDGFSAGDATVPEPAGTTADELFVAADGSRVCVISVAMQFTLRVLTLFLKAVAGQGHPGLVGCYPRKQQFSWIHLAI